MVIKFTLKIAKWTINNTNYWNEKNSYSGDGGRQAGSQGAHSGGQPEPVRLPAAALQEHSPGGESVGSGSEQGRRLRRLRPTGTNSSAQERKVAHDRRPQRQAHAYASCKLILSP